MAMTIEAEQTATELRRELADASAALERSSQARAQLEERLGAVREQLEREQRERRRHAEEHAETVGRLRKERRALRLVSTEHGAQGDDEGGGEDGEGAQQFETVRSQQNLHLLAPCPRPTPVRVYLARARLRDCHRS